MSSLGGLSGLSNLLSATAGGFGTAGSGGNALTANAMSGLSGGVSSNSGLSSNFGVGGGSFGTGTNYTAGQQLSNYSITGVGAGSSGGYSSIGDSRGRSMDSGRYGISSDSTTAKTRVFVRNVSIMCCMSRASYAYTQWFFRILCWCFEFHQFVLARGK